MELCRAQRGGRRHRGGSYIQGVFMCVHVCAWDRHLGALFVGPLPVVAPHRRMLLETHRSPQSDAIAGASPLP